MDSREYQKMFTSRSGTVSRQHVTQQVMPSAQHLRHMRVVVVSADVRSRFRLEAALSRPDLSVAVTARVAVGLSLAEVFNADVIVAQLTAAEMTGDEFTRQVRRRGIDVPLLIVGHHSLATSTNEDLSGIVEYLKAPIVSDDLLTVMFRLATRPFTDARVAVVMEMIEHRFAQSGLSLTAVAREVGVAREYLCRLLKRNTGGTFVAHLRETRVREATKLLRTTALSIKEVAVITGFRDASQLDRSFRKCRLCSPTAYRRLPD